MSDSRRPDDEFGRDDEFGPDELDRYIDGLLDDERRAAFERKLFADPELAAELERQRSLQSRLTAAFPVPEDAAALAQRALAGVRPEHDGRRRVALLPVAVAASVLAALGLWAMSDFDGGDGVDEAPAVVIDDGRPSSTDSATPAVVIDDQPRPGFTTDETPTVVIDDRGPGLVADGPGTQLQRVVPPAPGLQDGGTTCGDFGGLYAELAEDWRRTAVACQLPHDLALHLQDSLGQPLHIDATDEFPIEGPFTTRRWPTATLLVSPQQPEPILILVDQLARDPQPVLEAASPARLFRRELGDLVLYELTPWDTSRALAVFRLE